MGKRNPRKRSSSQAGSLVDHLGAMKMSATKKSGSEPSLESEDFFTNEELMCAIDGEIMEMVLGKKKLRELRRESYFCECCLRPGHFADWCPLKKYAEPGQPLGPGWVLLCRCCLMENSHRPGEQGVYWRACKRFCINMNCKAPGDHWLERCPYKIQLY